VIERATVTSPGISILLSYSGTSALGLEDQIVNRARPYLPTEAYAVVRLVLRKLMRSVSE
jgi:hypothetical protein